MTKNKRRKSNITLKKGGTKKTCCANPDYRFSHYEYPAYSGTTALRNAIMICRNCGNYVQQEVTEY